MTARGTGRLTDAELERKTPGRAARMAEIDAAKAAGVEHRRGRPTAPKGSPEAKEWGRRLSEKAVAARRQRKEETERLAAADKAAFVRGQAAEDARIGRATLRAIAQNTRLKATERARAAEILLAYGEGKPREVVETTGTQTLQVVISPKMAAAHADAIEAGNGQKQIAPATSEGDR